MDESDSETFFIPCVESKLTPRGILCQDKMECIEEDFYSVPDYKQHNERVPSEFYPDLPKREISLIYSSTDDYVEMKPVYESPSKSADKTALSPIKSCYVDLERAVVSSVASPMEISRQISLQRENSILIPKREVPLPFIESIADELGVTEFQASPPILVKHECPIPPEVDMPSEIDSVTLPNESQDIKFIKRYRGNGAKKRSLKDESEEAFANITYTCSPKPKKRKNDAKSSLNSTAPQEKIDMSKYLETEENYHQLSNREPSTKHKKPKTKSASKEPPTPVLNLDGTFSSTDDASPTKKKHRKKSSEKNHEKSSSHSEKRDSSSKKKHHDSDQKLNISTEKSPSHSEKRKSSNKKKEDHDPDQKINTSTEKSPSHSEKRKSSSKKKEDHDPDQKMKKSGDKSSSHSEKRKSSSKKKEDHEPDRGVNASSEKSSSHSGKRRSSSKKEENHKSDRGVNASSDKSSSHSEKRRSSSKKEEDHESDRVTKTPSAESSRDSDERESSSKKIEDHDPYQKMSTSSEKSSNHSEQRKSSGKIGKDHESEQETNTSREKSLSPSKKPESSSKKSSRRSSSSSRRSSSKSSSKMEKSRESEQKTNHPSKGSGEERERESSEKSRDEKKSLHDENDKLNSESDETLAVTISISDESKHDESHDCKKRKRDEMGERKSDLSTHIKEEVVDEGFVENSAVKTEEREKKSESKKRVCFAPTVEIKDEDRDDFHCDDIKRSSKKKKPSSSEHPRESQNSPKIKSEPSDTDTTYEEQIPELNPSVVIKREKLPRSKKRYTPNKLIDLTDPKYLKPFDFGWTREIVIRGTVTKGSSRCDVYYHSPQNKKVRSLREIEVLLNGDKNLCVSNFTLRHQRILNDLDNSKEIVRLSKTKKQKNCDNSLSSIEFNSAEDQKMYNELLESCTPDKQVKSLISTKGTKKSLQKSSRKSHEGHSSSSRPKKSSTGRPLKTQNTLQDPRNDQNVSESSTLAKKSSTIKSPKTQDKLQNQENSCNDIKDLESSSSKKKSSTPKSPRPRPKIQDQRNGSRERRPRKSSTPRKKLAAVEPHGLESKLEDQQSGSGDSIISESVIPSVTQKLNLTRSSPDEFSEIVPKPLISDHATSSQYVMNSGDDGPFNSQDVSKMCEGLANDQHTLDDHGFADIDSEIATDVPAVGLTIELTENDNTGHSDVDHEVELFNQKTMNGEYDSRPASLGESRFGRSRTSNLEELSDNSSVHHDSNITGDESDRMVLSNHTYRKDGSTCQNITTNDWMRSVDEVFKGSNVERPMHSSDSVLTTSISRKQDGPSPNTSLGSHSNPLKGPSPIENYTTEFLYATLQMNTMDDDTPVDGYDLDHDSHVVDEKYLPKAIAASEPDVKYSQSIADNTPYGLGSAEQLDNDSKLSATYIDCQTSMQSNSNFSTQSNSVDLYNPPSQGGLKHELSLPEEKYSPKIPEDSGSDAKILKNIFCPTSESIGLRLSKNHRKVIVTGLYPNNSAQKDEHFNSQSNIEADDTLIEHDISETGLSDRDEKRSLELPEVSESFGNIKSESKQRYDLSNSQSNIDDDDFAEQDRCDRQCSKLDEKSSAELAEVSKLLVKIESKQRNEHFNPQSNIYDDDFTKQDVSDGRLSKLDERFSQKLAEVSEFSSKLKFETKPDFTSELIALERIIKLENDEKLGSDLDVKCEIQNDGNLNLYSNNLKVDTAFDLDSSNHEFDLSGEMCLPKTEKSLDLDSDQLQNVSDSVSNTNALVSAVQLENSKELDGENLEQKIQPLKDGNISRQSIVTDDENSFNRKNASDNSAMPVEACPPRTIEGLEFNQKQVKSEVASTPVLNGFANTQPLENDKIVHGNDVEIKTEVQKDEIITHQSMTIDDDAPLDQNNSINGLEVPHERSSPEIMKILESNQKRLSNKADCRRKLICVGSIEDPECDVKPITNGLGHEPAVHENVEHVENGELSTTVSSVEPFDDADVLPDSIDLDAGETTKEDVTLSDLNYSPLGFDQPINGILKIKNKGLDQSQDKSRMSDSMSTTLSVSYDSDDRSTAICDSDDSEGSRHQSSPDDPETRRHQSPPNDPGLNTYESTGQDAIVASSATDVEKSAMDDTAVSNEVDDEDIKSENDSSNDSDSLSTMSQEIPVSAEPPYRVMCKNPDVEMNGRMHTEKTNDLDNSELRSSLPEKLVYPKVTSPTLETACSNASNIVDENHTTIKSEFTEEELLESYSQIVRQAGPSSANLHLNDSTVVFDQNEIIEQSTILGHGQMGIKYEDIIKNEMEEMSSSCQYEAAYEEASRVDSDFSDCTRLMSHFSGNSTLDALSDRSSLNSYQEDHSGLNETIIETKPLPTLESGTASTAGLERGSNSVVCVSSDLQTDHAKADSISSASQLPTQTLEKTSSDVPHAPRNIPTPHEDPNKGMHLYTEASVESDESLTRTASSISEDEECSFRCTVSEIRQVNAILAMDSELQSERPAAVGNAPPSFPPSAAEPVRPPKRARFSSLETHAYTHSMVSYSGLHKALKMAFHYLNFKDLLRCRETSQSFRDLAELRILWKKVCLNNSEMNRLLVEILNKYGTEHLKVVDQDDEDWASFIDAVSEMKYLSVLELCVCPAPVVEKIVEKCPQLRVISAQSIQSDCLSVDKIKNKDLEKLYLRARDSMSLIGDLTTIARFSKLTHLSLRSIKNLKMALVEAVQCSHGLVLLELGDCSEFDYNFGSTTLVYLQNLERLRLENVNKSSIADILRAVSKLGKLSHLELVNVDITVEFDANLHKCRNIRKLMLVPSYESKEKIAQTNKSILRNTYSLTDTLRNFTWGVNEDLVQLPVESSDEDSVQSTEPMFSTEMMKVLYGVGEERSAFQVVESDSFSLTTIQKFYEVHLPRTIVKILQIPSSEVLNLEM